MKNSNEKAMKAFADLMIEKIGQIDQDWQKPWVSMGFTGSPQNIHGRHYNGINALILMMLREKMNWRTPVFMTFAQSKQNGWDVKKGEHGFPVEFYHPVYRDKDGNKLTQEEFDNLSPAEKEECRHSYISRIYTVFNVEQTKMPEVAPDKWQRWVDQFAGGRLVDEQGKMRSVEMDWMLDHQTWVCPIQEKESNSAYYSPAKDHIVVPLRGQFVENEKFYGTLLHEMAHSTGHESRLAREMGGGFGSDTYGREELVAEMSAAMMAGQLGISKTIEPDNAAYLKSWLKHIGENPEFLHTVMNDVKKACNMIQEKVMNPQMAEDIKNEAIESIDKFLEEKKEVKAEMGIPHVSGEELLSAVPSLSEAGVSQLPSIEPIIIEALDKGRNETPDACVWVTDDKYCHVVGDDALAMQKALKLTPQKAYTPTGEMTDYLRFSRDNLSLYLPQAVRKGNRIAVSEVETIVRQEEKKPEAAEGPALKTAFLGNGITAWEEGDNDYTAHISPDRVLRMDKQFSPANVEKLQKLAETGNLIVGNDGAQHLALQPLNMATRFLHQPYGGQPLALSVEQVGDRQILCNRQQLVLTKDGGQPDLAAYPEIHRPDSYLVSVTGIDNVRRSLQYMQRAGIDTASLHDGAFFESLETAEQTLSPIEKDLRRLCFRVENGADGHPAITAYATGFEALDAEERLPRFWMNGNEMRYNQPSQQQIDGGLSIDRMVLSQGCNIRVNGRDNVLDTLDTLAHYGVSVTPAMADSIRSVYDEGQSMPRNRADRDKIYLHVKYGIVGDFALNISEYSVDDEPMFEVRGGKLQKAGLYDRDVQNAYLVAGLSRDGTLLDYVKIGPADDALDQANRHFQHMIAGKVNPDIVSVRLLEVDRDFKDSVAFRMAGRQELQQMMAEGKEGTFKELGHLPSASQKKENTITNPINDTTMAKKSKEEEAQVQAPETQKEVNKEKQDNQQQEEKKVQRDGSYVKQAYKDKQPVPGVFVAFRVKDGQRSEVATISKEDREQYFAEIKGKSGEEAESIRAKYVDKYIGQDGKRLDAAKQNTFQLKHVDADVAARITDAKVYKREKDGVYGVRCTIDGTQQMGRTFDTKNDNPRIAQFNKNLLNAFFDGYKDLAPEQQAERRIDVAAAKFKDVLEGQKQEQARGRGM